MYDFIVDFVGTIPTEFTFIYTILTLILSIAVLATFTSIFYFVLRFLREVI